MIRMACLRRFFFLVLAFSRATAQHFTLQDGRELIRADRAPDGVVWVVQLSDLHISSYHADRARSLKAFLGPLLALINPALVLITGDLTDAKSKDRTNRRQDEEEWVQYWEAMSKVIDDSGLPQYAFYDLRGNHDKFGVPEVGGALDYFSRYSISAARNRTDTIQSVTLMSRGWKHLFVGVDTSMGIGLRGPCNLFGHPTDEQLRKIDLELSQWDSCVPEKITKIVFGHFPMSFTASTETRNRLEQIFTKHSILAYICGHLHTNFGTNLLKHYTHQTLRSRASNSCESSFEGRYGEFWEWEMGDWRMCRIVRIIAIDEGHASFVDFDFSSLNASTGNELPTLVIPTYPLDSQKMQRLMPFPLSSSRMDSVRALVFSQNALVSVVAKFFDTITGELVLVEELEMHMSSKVGDSNFLYLSHWNSTKYMDHSATRYVLQIVVVDSVGQESYSSLRPFSLNNSIGRLKQTWAEFFVMGLTWDDAFPILMWAALITLVTLFILPKFYLCFLLKKGYYSKWVLSLFGPDSNQKFRVNKALQLFLWFFIQGCGNGAIWWGQLLTIIWLIFFPWFWGQVLAEGYPIAYMSILGWTVHIGGNSPSQVSLGWPDLMVIILPYFYFVLLPLFILIFALSAEKSAYEFCALDSPTYLKKKEQLDGSEDERCSFLMSSDPAACTDSGTHSLPPEGLMSRPHLNSWKPVLHKKHTSTRWLRIFVMLGCLLVSFVHFGQACALVGAYGVMALFASPGFAWPVPVLMIAAVLQATSKPK